MRKPTTARYEYGGAVLAISDLGTLPTRTRYVRQYVPPGADSYPGWEERYPDRHKKLPVEETDWRAVARSLEGCKVRLLTKSGRVYRREAILEGRVAWIDHSEIGVPLASP